MQKQRVGKSIRNNEWGREGERKREENSSWKKWDKFQTKTEVKHFPLLHIDSPVKLIILKALSNKLLKC